ALVDDARESRSDDKSLLIVGALADVIEDQFRRLFLALGIDNIQFLPGRTAGTQPAIGPNTHYLLAQPFLRDTAQRLDRLGATRIDAPFPIGAEGTTEWLRAAANAWGVEDSKFERVVELPRSRAERALVRYRETLQDKSIFFFPDSQLEVPLARFLNRELGMSLVEVGTPYIHQDLLGPELAMLEDATRLSEGQDVDRQLDRCLETRPDITVCGLGLANPLEAQGLVTKWSIELMFSPIQGYDQAGDAAELFARPLVRKRRLAV
ncbi:MAG: ferredoxin:protochlorophyllide reductase (ATP-dependent) subunit N, partial [Pseudomonadota bacterium]